MKPTLIVNHTAETQIGQYELVAFGSAPGKVVRATDANKPFGVNLQPGTTAIGERLDVVECGIAEVVFGGVVAAGDPITSDADGRAIKANLAVGSPAVVGFARHAAAADEVGEISVFPVMP